MKWTIVMGLILTSLVVQSAEGEDQKKKVDANFCGDLVQRICEGKPLSRCMAETKKEKRHKDMGVCVGLLTRQEQHGDLKKEVSDKIGDFLERGKGQKDEALSKMDRCNKVAEKACGDLSLEACIETKANQFPSFCRKKLGKDTSERMVAHFQEKRAYGSCRQEAFKKCQLEFKREPKLGESHSVAEIKEAINRQKNCMEKMVAESKNCQALVKDIEQDGEKTTQIIPN